MKFRIIVAILLTFSVSVIAQSKDELAAKDFFGEIMTNIKTALKYQKNGK